MTVAFMCTACATLCLAEDDPSPATDSERLCEKCWVHFYELVDLHKFQPKYYVPRTEILARRANDIVDDLIALRERLG